ncbi:anaerobic C4-dicarboxylate transporter [Ramlibacter sp. RBP-2]|uniref:C4-dicarboxylate transporter n=1 Tax=Ramlibacter lithotrophicus TaxID=2606681 RepID=A0A7X6DEE5_9BURK|nr:anaerobic C4-dicarboxylate transporter [Ramlibacter lithotrophicus]NKE65652.1 anaerobic C4-dicarboxylate transporter [Ramlibacter lithotrophicus]
MTSIILLQFAVVLGAIWLGARSAGVGLGLWGGVGLLVLVVAFGINPTSPPVDVMLIILAVIMAASVMDAAGGIDFLVRIAERIIRANPKYVTIVAPLTTWTFTFLAGTGHIVYPLLPVIYETAHQNGIRPERPMAVATIASQQAITASPVAAATAAMIGLFAEKGMADWGLAQILMICVPSTLAGVVVAAVVSMFMGKDLKNDLVYQQRLKDGLIPPPQAIAARPPLKPAAKRSALIFLAGVALVVVLGFFPSLRTLPGAKSALGMPVVIELVMLSVAAVMLLATRVAVDDVPKTATLRAGVVATIGIFGLAWLGDSFIAANKEVIVPAIGEWAKFAPWTFALGLFFASVLLYSQAATTRALMPLGVALGLPPQFLIGMFPAVNGYFFIPTYGSLIAAINFDLSGTTRIGKYVLNHSFMIPGIVATGVAVVTGLAMARVVF